jgi:hypothetical protein
MLVVGDGFEPTFSPAPEDGVVRDVPLSLLSALSALSRKMLVMVVSSGT